MKGRKDKKKVKKPMTGVHILGEITTSKIRMLTEMSGILRKEIFLAIRKEHLTKVGYTYHSFATGGFSFIVALAESHMSIHTWPEINYITLDVFVCNHSKDNSLLCKKLFNNIANLFVPSKINKRIVLR